MKEKDIFLPTFRLEKIDKKNRDHWDYLCNLHTSCMLQEILPDAILTLVETKREEYPYIPYFGKTKIGFIKVWELPFEKVKTAEIEYVLDPKYRNHSLGSKLITELSDYLLSDKAVNNNLQFQDIVARISPDNISSILTIDKAGFELKKEYGYLEFHKRRK